MIIRHFPTRYSLLAIRYSPMDRTFPMTPRVLVSDRLSETAVQIFRDRGLAVDYKPDLGKDKDALLAAIPAYDGLAIRSATKVTPKVIAAANRLRSTLTRAKVSVMPKTARRISTPPTAP